MTAPSYGDLRNKCLANRVVPHMRKDLIERQMTSETKSIRHRLRRCGAKQAGNDFALPSVGIGRGNSQVPGAAIALLAKMHASTID